MTKHAGGRPGAQHLDIVDAVPAGDQAVHQREELAAWAGRAGAVTEVDQLVGGLLQAEPLASVAGSSNPALATARSSSKAASTWSSTTWEDRIEKVPS
jgi:hypothetical protein